MGPPPIGPPLYLPIGRFIISLSSTPTAPRSRSGIACQFAYLGALMPIIVTYVAVPRETLALRGASVVAAQGSVCDTIHKRQGPAASARWGARARTLSFGDEPAIGPKTRSYHYLIQSMQG